MSIKKQSADSSLVVIPVRWASTRFPGKPLAMIAGEAMVSRVWRQAKKSKLAARVLIATDDERIKKFCEQHDMDVIMTSDQHATGTDRIFEVSQHVAADIYINVQGDEPLMDPSTIDAVINCLQKARKKNVEVATAYLANATKEQINSLSCVHLLPSQVGTVISFSRLPIPCAFQHSYEHTVHLGIYAYTAAALKRFMHYPRGPVEMAESIEPLRFLEQGEKIACVEVASASIGVDHPEDIVRVEAIISGQAKS